MTLFLVSRVRVSIPCLLEARSLTSSLQKFFGLLSNHITAGFFQSEKADKPEFKTEVALNTNNSPRNGNQSPVL
jgi:hypothetical protein